MNTWCGSGIPLESGSSRILTGARKARGSLAGPTWETEMTVSIKGVNDLGRHVGPLRAELEEAVREVIASGWFVLGRQVTAFEDAFAAYCGTEFCVSVANGTDALELALKALGISSGERVATVANAGMYSTTAILAAGARPVYADIDPQTLLIDPKSLCAVLAQQRPAALIVTHLYGRMVDMPMIVEMTRAHDVLVIEDCAQAHGALLAGRRSGAWGDLGCFSFYPTKNLGALGDGGAVVTASVALAERLRGLRQYGWVSKYRADLPGGRNSRLDELQAALLARMLPYLDGWNARRRAIAVAYSAGIVHPRVRSSASGGEDYVAHLYVVRCDEREALRTFLAEAGIPSEVHYPLPDYRQLSLAGVVDSVELGATDLACSEVLTLPCFPEMTDEEVAAIIERVNAW